MSEVSGKVLSLFRKIAERTDVANEQMFGGTSIEFGGASDPEYITWDDFCVLAQNARMACGSDQKLADMGAEVLELPVLGQFISIIQLFASAKTLYWASQRWTGPMLFNHLLNELEEGQGGVMHFTITIPSSYRDSPEFFHLNGGVMRRLPRLIGLPEAFVELAISPHQCVYTIDAPPSITLWARFRRAFAVLFSARTAIEELGAQQSLLSRRFKELQSTRDEAIEARAAAEDALAVKSQFLATMSHELRTPLNGVIGMSELLMQTSLDEEQHEYASTVMSCGESLLQLINNVLDYSKLEVRKVSVESNVFDVRDVVENVLDMLGAEARRQRTELGADFGDIPRWIKSDPQRLQQILVNLVGNAVKFTLNGEVFVSVREVEHDDQGCVLEFSIRDTGPGIPEQFLPKLFAPFTQADSSSTRAYGGTGLGLAISKELTECLGGAIEVESVAGRGSTFRFTIRTEIASAPANHTSLEALGRYSVLVVDDNPTSRLILIATLQRWGLSVQAVATGREALDILERRTFDVAIVDLRMPDIDGLTLTQKIGAMSTFKTPKILMLTASANREDALAARAVGVQAYLTKPFRQEQLHRSIAQLVGGSVGETREDTKEVRADVPRRNVLVVDDNPINLRFALHAIRRLGFGGVGASCGAEAIELVCRQSFDFIFMDCEMPQMNGYDTTHAIRELAHGAQVPIVALTAHTTDDVRARCKAVGMNDFLPKPPGLDSFKQILERWLPPSSLPSIDRE